MKVDNKKDESDIYEHLNYAMNRNTVVEHVHNIAQIFLFKILA